MGLVTGPAGTGCYASFSNDMFNKPGFKSSAANALTGMRILCAFLIIVFPVFSKGFYALYLLGGLTDAIDGTVARALKQESEFGEKLDTIGDICFALVVLGKVIKAVHVPAWLMIWVGAIAVIKAAGIVIGLLIKHGFPAIHSALNKICGVLLFAFPLVVGHFPWQGSMLLIIITCLTASAAAIQEVCLICRRQ